MKNKYTEKINYSIETNQEVPYAFLHAIESEGYTCLSKEVNEWIFNIVKYYYNEKNYADIIHYCQSEIGAFATLSDDNLSHHDLNEVKNISAAVEESYFNQVSRLFLIDYTDYFKWVNPPVDLIDHLFKTLYKKNKIIICAPECHFLNDKFNIRELLKNNDFFIESIFVYKGNVYSEKTNEIDSSTPLGLVFDSDSLNLIVASKKPNDKEFVCEYKENKSNFEIIFNNIKSFNQNTDIAQGIYLDSDLYVGSVKWNSDLAYKEKIDKIEGQLSKFNLISIDNIVSEFVLINDDKVDFLNYKLYLSIHKMYLNKSAYKIHCSALAIPVKTDDITLYGISLLNDDLLPEYIYYFFNSSIGLELLPLIKFDFDSFRKIKIPYPSFKIQENIIYSHRILNLAKNKLDSISFDAMNCLSTSDGKYPLIEKYFNIIEIFEELSDYEFIKKIIKNGESKIIEFKQTLSLDIKKNSKEKYIEDACIKTIAAFLNTLGGTLLVGVSDDGEIIGIDDELKLFHQNSIDKMQLHFKNIFKTRIGEQFYPYIDSRIILIDSYYVLIVKCDRSQTESYVDDKDFYVRTNPATDKLEGPKVIEYIKNHFAK